MRLSGIGLRAGAARLRCAYSDAHRTHASNNETPATTSCWRTVQGQIHTTAEWAGFAGGSGLQLLCGRQVVAAARIRFSLAERRGLRRFAAEAFTNLRSVARHTVALKLHFA